jgi:predicted TIM-barrel fold metal-dependent hydrolase
MRSVEKLLIWGLCSAGLVAAACRQSATDRADLDPAILSEVRGIRAIDDHAHPVRMTAAGEKADRDFDALPVDNMEPASDPVQMRVTDPGVVAAWKALWNYPYNDTSPQHIHEWQAHKKQVAEQKGAGYPAWVLDQMGVEIMLGNRVLMGTSVEQPRFRWVPYADALLFPLDNSHLAQKNSDRKAFFADEEVVLRRYLSDAGFASPPKTLDDYLKSVVTPTLERHKQGGAVAEKFEAAYLRSLAFDKVEHDDAARLYANFIGKAAPEDQEYKRLQDFLFRYIASECGRLGMAVQLHTMAGAGSYFEVGGANPILLESVFNDPTLRKTKFVMIHGGWPFNREIAAMLTKPNVYLDYSQQSLAFPPATLARSIREWLEWVPEKVMFGTDAYPFLDEIGWEESGWLASSRGREALARALSGMVHDEEISRERASELARMVMRDNARSLYGF